MKQTKDYWEKPNKFTLSLTTEKKNKQTNKQNKKTKQNKTKHQKSQPTIFKLFDKPKTVSKNFVKNIKCNNTDSFSFENFIYLLWVQYIFWILT